MADPKIKYDIEAAVKGEADALELATALRNVGDVLEGDLQKSALDAAQALEALSAKQRALDEFARLRRETEAASASLEAATREVDRFGAELPQASANTRNLADAERVAAAALADAQAILTSKKEALRQLRDETGGAARRTDEFKATEAGLRESIAASNAEVRARKLNLSSVTQSLTQATSAEKSLGKEYEHAIEVARAASIEVGNRNRRLEESRGVLAAAGVSTNNLVEADRDLRAELARVSEGSVALKSSLQGAADQMKSVEADGRTAAEAAKALDDAFRQLGIRGAKSAEEEVRRLQAALDHIKNSTDVTPADKQAAVAAFSARLADLRTAANRAAQDGIGKLTTEIDRQTEAIRATLQVEQSEISLQQAHLQALRASAQARLQAAQASGDEAAATRAQIDLRRAEGDLTDQLARGKRAEAAAIQAAVNVRREELAAIGPLTAAQTQELRAAENRARTLRVEAAAADQAAARVRDLSTAHQGGASSAADMGTRVQGLTQVLGQMGAALGVAMSMHEFVQAAAQMEQLQAGLQAVSGDASVAAAQMEFVRQMATRAGVDVGAAASAFLGLAAATKGTAVEGEPTRRVFEAVVTAMAKAGKSSAETQNALQALSQIASKGTVSMEELRQQLGEALPGALQAAAKGLGITTQDLIQLVESGQLAAEDLFPALAKGLNELYGTAPSAQALSQEITNIKNAFVDMSSHVGESGALNALKVGAELAQTGVTLLGTSLVATGKALGVLVAAITTLDFSGAKEAFAAIEAEGRDKLVRAAQHNTVLAAAIRLVGDDAIKAELAVAQAGAATAQAGQQAEQAGTSYTNLATDYAKVCEELKGQIELAEKELESVKARGQAAVEQAKLLGDEAAVRKAVANAAADEAAASAQLAERKQNELNVLRVELESKRYVLEQAGKVSEQRKKELAELEQLIAKKQLDVDKTNAQAAASQAKAKANSQEVLAAKALTEATDAKVKARSAEAQASLNLLQGQKSLADQAVELARLSGNDYELRRAKIAQLEIEIKLIQAKAAVMKAEAEGEIAVANAKRAELQASGPLAEAKRIELDAAIKLAESKVKLAEATGQSTAGLDKQLQALRMGKGALDDHAKGAQGAAADQGRFGGAVSGATTALERQNAALERNIAAQEKANELKERADALERKRLNIDKEGYSLNTNGQRVQQTVETENSLFNQLVSGGMDAATADRMAKQLFQQYQVWSKGTGGMGTSPSAGSAPEWLSQPFQNLINAELQRYKVRQASTPAATASPASTTAKTYNVTLNGRTVRTASDADARALMDMLEQARRAA